MNAKEELLSEIGALQVIAATISMDYISRGTSGAWNLKVGHSSDDWLEFLKNLDFEYVDGFRYPCLLGTVWLSDGTWLDRGHCNGTEWWVHRVCPEIPDSLK